MEKQIKLDPFHDSSDVNGRNDEVTKRKLRGIFQRHSREGPTFTCHLPCTLDLGYGAENRASRQSHTDIWGPCIEAGSSFPNTLKAVGALLTSGLHIFYF